MSHQGSAWRFDHGCHCDKCTKAKAHKVRKRYKIGAGAKPKPWTDHELDYILAREGDRYLHSAAEAAIELGRSVASIDNARRRARRRLPSEPVGPEWGGFDQTLGLPSGF